MDHTVKLRVERAFLGNSTIVVVLCGRNAETERRERNAENGTPKRNAETERRDGTPKRNATETEPGSKIKTANGLELELHRALNNCTAAL